MKIDTEKAISFLNEKWNNMTCPYCHCTEWNVSDKAFELREFNNGNMYLGGPNAAITPVVTVTCNNCGNTVLINALITGILEDK